MQFFGIEDIKNLSKASSTTIEWAAGSNLRIGGQAYNVTSVLTLDTATDIDTGSIANNSFYYIYAVVVAGTVSLKYSLSNSAPAGYSAYRLIGSFGTDDISEISGTSNKDQGKVGDVIHSMLTEEQFIAENGAGWILADGRDVTGSKYATVTGNTTVPDMRGQFLRGKNNTRSDGQQNPDGDLALGTFQDDAFQGHRHEMGYINISSGGSSFGMVISTNPASNTAKANAGPEDPISDGVNGSPRISSETRSKNITVNIFIKIEDIAV